MAENEELDMALGLVYTATRDPNRVTAGQTVQWWPDHVRRLHEAVVAYWHAETEAREDG